MRDLECVAMIGQRISATVNIVLLYAESIKIKAAILFLIMISINANPCLSLTSSCSCNNTSISNERLSIAFGSQCLDTVGFSYPDGNWSDILSIEKFAVSSDSFDSFKVSDRDFSLSKSCTNESDGIAATLRYNGLNITRKIYLLDHDSPAFQIKYVMMNENSFSLENVAFYESLTYSNSTRGESNLYDDGLWVVNNDGIRCRLNSLGIPFDAYGAGRWNEPVESDWSDVLNGIKLDEMATSQKDLSLAMKWILGNISPNQYKELILNFTLDKYLPNTQLLASPHSWDAGACERCTEKDIKVALSARGLANVNIENVISPEWIDLLSPLPLKMTLTPDSDIYMRVVLNTSRENKSAGDITIFAKAEDGYNDSIQIPVSVNITASRIDLEASNLFEQYNNTARELVSDTSQMAMRTANSGGTLLVESIPADDILKKVDEKIIRKLGTPRAKSRASDDSDSFDGLQAGTANSNHSQNSYWNAAEELWDWSDAIFDIKARFLNDRINDSEIGIYSYLYDEMNADAYINKSGQKKEDFKEKYCAIKFKDREKVIKYLKSSSIKIENSPLMPIHQVGEIGLSFKSNREFYDFIDQASTSIWSDVAIALGSAGIVLGASTTGAGVGMIIPILENYDYISFTKEILAFITLSLSTLVGFESGSMLISDNYHDLEQTFNSILADSIPEMINDPEGPYVSVLEIASPQIGEEGNFNMTFVNNQSGFAYNITPSILIKSVTGNLIGVLSGEFLPKIGPGENHTFNISFQGWIPGTYNASSMVSYNNSSMTPPFETTFWVRLQDSHVESISKDDKVVSRGAPVHLEIGIQNNESSDGTMLLLTTLLSPSGSLLNTSMIDISKSIEHQNIKITLSTQNASSDGINRIETILFDSMYPISSSSASIIIGNESSAYEGATLDTGKLPDSFDPSKPIKVPISIENTGNVGLKATLSWVLEGNGLDKIDPDKKTFANIDPAEQDTDDLPFAHKNPLMPGLYRANITLVNQSGGLLDRISVPIAVRGKGIQILISSAEKDFYSPGELVNITGKVSDEVGYNISDANISVRILDPSGELSNDALLQSDKQGYFNLSFYSTEQNGTYTVISESSKEGYPLSSDRIHFIVSEPSASKCIISMDKDYYSLKEPVRFAVNVSSRDLPIDSSLSVAVILPNGTMFSVPTLRRGLGEYIGYVSGNLLDKHGSYRISVNSDKAYYKGSEEWLDFVAGEMALPEISTVNVTVENSSESISLSLISPISRELISDTKNIALAKVGTFSAGSKLKFAIEGPGGDLESTDPDHCMIERLGLGCWKLSWRLNDSDSGFHDLVMEVESISDEMEWSFEKGFEGWTRSSSASGWNVSTEGTGLKAPSGQCPGMVLIEGREESNETRGGGSLTMDLIIPEGADELNATWKEIDSGSAIKIFLGEVGEDDSGMKHSTTQESPLTDCLKASKIPIGSWQNKPVQIRIESTGPGVDLYSLDITNSSHGYERNTSLVSWRDAVENAHSSNIKNGQSISHLVTIENDRENLRLKELAERSGLSSFWIGLTDENRETHFEWINGEDATIDNLPESTIRNYAYVDSRSGEWNLSDNKVGRAYIIEIEPTMQPGYSPSRPIDPCANYPFDDETARDDSGNNRNGSIEGSPEFSDGLSGKALFLSGREYAHLPRSIGSDFSIVFWVKTNQQSDEDDNWYNGVSLVDAEIDGCDLDFGIALLSGGKVGFGTGGKGYWRLCEDQNTLKSESSISDGEWHQIAAIRRNSGDKLLYIDRQLESSGSGISETLYRPSEIYVGYNPEAYQPTRHWLVGEIDEISFFDRALSDAEVKSLYDALSGS
jgi:hypothetical protein